MIATASIVTTLALDTLVGEPPDRIHPVALLGRLIDPLDREWHYPRVTGLVVALGLPLLVAVPLGVLTAIALSLDPLLAGALATLVLFATTSLRSLLAAATTVIDGTAEDVDTARSDAIALVGRDTDSLSPADLRSAAIESVAENLADGLVAPLTAFALGAIVSLPLAVAGAAFVKVVNTLDSMLGYPDKAHGWASARLDDLVMWLPARISALLISIVAGTPQALTGVRPAAHRPASPNSGWPMATMAAVLDVRLAKLGAYELNEHASPPTIDDARRGVRIVGIAGVASFAIAGVVAWF